jgi:hypothetical protein
MRSSEFRVIDKQSIQPVTHHNYVALLLSVDLLGHYGRRVEWISTRPTARQGCIR